MRLETPSVRRVASATVTYRVTTFAWLVSTLVHFMRLRPFDGWAVLELALWIPLTAWFVWYLTGFPRARLLWFIAFVANAALHLYSEDIVAQLERLIFDPWGLISLILNVLFFDARDALTDANLPPRPPPRRDVGLKKLQQTYNVVALGSVIIFFSISTITMLIQISTGSCTLVNLCVFFGLWGTVGGFTYALYLHSRQQDAQEAEDDMLRAAHQNPMDIQD